jgi:predicted neutral ceramidase superfamily lipid hydrolase
MDRESIRYAQYGILATLAAANFYIVFGKNSTLKRALLPVLGALASVSLLLFLALIGLPSRMLYLAVPVVILMIVLNLRQFKICGSCSSLVRGAFFAVPKECHKCGAKVSVN